MKPPLFSRLLLLALAGEMEAEFVAGDLYEEFADVAARLGKPSANHWYWRQVVRSAAPLLGMRVRSGEMTVAVLAGMAGAALPLWVLDRLWALVYSLIPLKDGLDRATGFLAANLICLCLGAALSGISARTRARAIAGAGCALAAAGLALWTSIGATPWLYAVLALVAAPASSMSAFAWRRSR
jgi:hypothetical protein